MRALGISIHIHRAYSMVNGLRSRSRKRARILNQDLVLDTVIDIPSRRLVVTLWLHIIVQQEYVTCSIHAYVRDMYVQVVFASTESETDSSQNLRQIQVKNKHSSCSIHSHVVSA